MNWEGAVEVSPVYANVAFFQHLILRKKFEGQI